MLSLNLFRWSKRSGVEVAQKVQMIFERAENEVNAGNQRVHLTLEMFSLTMDTWLKSGSVDAPRQCENLLQWLCFRQRKLKPTTNIFNAGT